MLFIAIVFSVPIRHPNVACREGELVLKVGQHETRVVGEEHDRYGGREVIDERVAKGTDSEQLPVALEVDLDRHVPPVHFREQPGWFRICVQRNRVAQTMRTGASRLGRRQGPSYVPLRAELPGHLVAHFAGVQRPLHVRVVGRQFAEHPHVEVVVADRDRVGLGVLRS